MLCLSCSSLCIFLFFSSLNILSNVFVSKFQGSKSNSLSVALIWSTSCIHGFDWKNWLFINTFIFILLSFLNDLSCRYQIGLKSKIIWGSFFFCNYLHQSFSQSVNLSVCLSIYLSVFPSIWKLVPHSQMVTMHWWEDFASQSLPNA